MNSQAFCIVRRQETIRSLPEGPSGLHPYSPPGRPNNIGFLPRIVPEIALLICRSLCSPCGVPFGPSIIVPGGAYLFLRLSTLECLNILTDCMTCRLRGCPDKCGTLSCLRMRGLSDERRIDWPPGLGLGRVSVVAKVRVTPMTGLSVEEPSVTRMTSG